MRVLVTGASGFIGSALADALTRRNVTVIGAGRSATSNVSGIEWRQADLSDPAVAVSIVHEVRPTHILHLAWFVEHGRFWLDRANLDWVGASMALATAAIDAGCERFVGVGTCYEYDWPVNADCNEFSTPLSSSTLYGTAKDATRRLMQTMFQQTDCSFAWARVFFPYGAGEGSERLVPSVARALLRGDEAKCSRGLAFRDFINVRDAGDALAQLILSPVEGAVNIGSGNAVRIRDVAKKLARLACREDLLRIGALPDRPFDPPRITASIDRLRDEVGFVPKFSLDDGLVAALEYWRAAS